jgi:LL-diaminopimelate aminotransferase
MTYGGSDNSVKFWGTANISQQGAIAALSEIGADQNVKKVVNYYLKNSRVLRQGLEKSMDFKCFGGMDSPFVWVKATPGLSSWQFFEKMLQSTGIVGVPGCIFGLNGEGYLRLSALGRREEIVYSLHEFE